MAGQLAQRSFSVQTSSIYPATSILAEHLLISAAASFECRVPFSPDRIHIFNAAHQSCAAGADGECQPSSRAACNLLQAKPFMREIAFAAQWQYRVVIGQAFSPVFKPER